MTATTATTAPGLTDSTGGCERATGAAEPELGIADVTVLTGTGDTVRPMLGTRAGLASGVPVGCVVGTSVVGCAVGVRDVGLLDAGAREAGALGARVGMRVRGGFEVGLRVGPTVGVRVRLALGAYVHASDVRAKETWYPAATASSWWSSDSELGMLSSLRGTLSYVLPDKSGRPSWPCSLLPHVYTEPPAVMAIECSSPAAIDTTGPSIARAGIVAGSLKPSALVRMSQSYTPNWPLVFKPNTITLPSAASASVWYAPHAIVLTRRESRTLTRCGECCWSRPSPRPSCPKLLPPQAYTCAAAEPRPIR